MAYKLVVLDIDGTLLDPGHALTPRARAAVRATRAAGCIVTLASGRRLWQARDVAAELGITAPLILYNGGFVYDLASEVPVHMAALEPGCVRAAVDLLWDEGYLPVVFENPLRGERIFTGPVERQSAAEAHYFARRQQSLVRVSRDALGAVIDPLLLWVMGEEGDVRRLETRVIEAGLNCQTLVEAQSFVPGSSWWQVDLMAPGCSKGAAFLKLCELTGVAPDETLAVGDGINDLELIELAGFGVAMGNAVAEVRERAQAIVADNANDGVAEALERYILQR